MKFYSKRKIFDKKTSIWEIVSCYLFAYRVRDEISQHNESPSEFIIQDLEQSLGEIFSAVSVFLESGKRLAALVPVGKLWMLTQVVAELLKNGKVELEKVSD